MNLHDLTPESHHDAQETDFGKRYAKGDISRREYASWIHMQFVAHHEVLDRILPWHCQRGATLALDLAALLPDQPYVLSSVDGLREVLLESPYTGLAGAYVLMGAHLRGGAMIRPNLERAGLPVHHLYFDAPASAREYLRKLREFPALADEVDRVFRAVTTVMDEIHHMEIMNNVEQDLRIPARA
jgi:hypothetical protein